MTLSFWDIVAGYAAKQLVEELKPDKLGIVSGR
jgi:hypothetical protein